MTSEILPNEPKKKLNKKLSREILINNNDYFDKEIRPMLQKGSEDELCNWLKQMHLIKSSMHCPREECSGKDLKWSSSGRRMDKFIWCCNECSQRISIRDESIFFKIPCDLKLCLQLILSWCQSVPLDQAVEYFQVKVHIVDRLYEKLDQVTENYIKHHLDEFKLGGPGKCVIIDEYPSKYMTKNNLNTTITRKRKNCHTVICMLEVESIPPKMWFHILQSVPVGKSKTKPKNYDTMSNEAIGEIEKFVKPGTIIIANNQSTCCNYNFISGKNIYQVYSIEFLQQLDMPSSNQLIDSLDTIWETGYQICENIQDLLRSNGIQYISSYLWKQKFSFNPEQAFNNILKNISGISEFK